MKEVKIGEYLDKAERYQNGGIIGKTLVIHECIDYVVNTARDRSPNHATFKTPFYYPMPSKIKTFESQYHSYEEGHKKCYARIDKVNLDTGILTVDETIE